MIYSSLNYEFDYYNINFRFGIPQDKNAFGRFELPFIVEQICVYCVTLSMIVIVFVASSNGAKNSFTMPMLMWKNFHSLWWEIRYKIIE